MVMWMQVSDVTISIEGSEDTFTEEQLAAYAIAAAKVDFLLNYDPNIKLSQLQYMLGTLPDSIYWEENRCGSCDANVKFKKEDIKNWHFDEGLAKWLCPMCLAGIGAAVEAGAIPKTAKEAGEKAKAIEAKAEEGGDPNANVSGGPMCLECGTELEEGACPNEACPMHDMPQEDGDEDVEEDKDDEGIGIMPEEEEEVDE